MIFFNQGIVSDINENKCSGGVEIDTTERKCRHLQTNLTWTILIKVTPYLFINDKAGFKLLEADS